MKSIETVLVIGNGFDLAHNYKTSYSDFVEFLKSNSNKKDIRKDLLSIIEKNAFVKYLIGEDDIDKAYWSDLETLLLHITDAIEDFFDNIHEHINSYGCVKKMSNLMYKIFDYFDFVDELEKEMSGRTIIKESLYSKVYGTNWKEIKKYMNNELNGLKQALIIYLKYYLDSNSNDKHVIINQIKEINPDSIVTFNYTDKYNLYDFDCKKIIHVHGDLCIGRIVLGYDDKNIKNLRFINYKKYFQRIEYNLPFVGTSKHINSSNGFFVGKHVHIYGLSLDKKDNEIINQISYANKIYIYYLKRDDNDDFEQKIANLIDIFGKDIVLELTGNKKLNFVEIVQ